MTLATPNIAAPLRPLAETAAQFRHECYALDHLVEELYRDVERLRDELARKADEVEEGRRSLAQKGAQLAEQRKESGRLVQLLERQEVRVGETLAEVKSLREQTEHEREEAQRREAARVAFLEQKLRAAESERDEVRHQLTVLQATSAAAGDHAGSVDTLAPLLSELGSMRHQISDTQTQLGEARTQLTAAIEQATLAAASAAAGQGAQAVAPELLAELAEMRRQLNETQAQCAATQSQLTEAHAQLAGAIERSAAASAQQSVVVPAATAEQPVSDEQLSRLAELERERVELESELELVRTRATELHEVVAQQRRELVEQRADITTELRLLRELVEQPRQRAAEGFESEDESALVGAASRSSDGPTAAPDPVVSSVMAQFARLQKDVAQRRKKK